jgi:hypothetical protein
MTTTIVVSAGVAVAQPTNAQRANALNDEGKDLMEQQRYGDASDRFQQATLLSQEGRFYFNLCVSRFHEGKFGLSLQACQAVEKAGADAKLKDKTNKMIGKVKEEIRKLGHDPDQPMVDPNTTPPDPNNPNNTPPDPNNPNNTPPDPNNPNNTPPDPNNPNNTPPGPNPNPNVQNPNAIVGAPPPTTALNQPPDHKYTWTLGADIYGGSAKWGDEGMYGTNAYGFRVIGDFLAMPSRKVGFQAWLGVVHSDSANSLEEKIDVIDVGIGAYKHLCRGRLCFTPLLGVELGLMQPEELEGSSAALIAFGARIEGRVGYAFGPRFEHLLTLAVGPQIYTAGLGEATDQDGFPVTGEDVGLGAPSVAFLVGLGYTYRFNTPFGSSLYTLE